MEPERKIEKLLHAFAKKRRDQAGNALELHPVARQQLQKEVLRLASGKSETRGFLSLFSRFRPTLAFAVCFLVLVSVSLWLLVPALTGKKSQRMASVDTGFGKDLPAEQAQQQPAATPTFAAAPPPAESGQKKALSDNRTAVFDSAALKTPRLEESQLGTTVERKSETAPAVSPEKLAFGVNSDAGKFRAINGFGQSGSAAQTNSWAGIPVASSPSVPAELPVSTGAAVAVDSFAVATPADGREAERMPQPIAGPVVTRSSAAPVTLAAGSAENLQRQKAPAAGALGGSRSYSFAKTDTATAAPVVSQRFYRIDSSTTRQRAPAAVSGAAPVLASFQLEQKGAEIRVVDADGSVYTGVLQTAPDELQKNSVVAQTARNQPVAAQNYFFRVTGTNRNLNQNLVFSGSLIPLTNAPSASVNRGSMGGGMGAAPSGAVEPSTQSFLSNSRISGKAVIGNQKEIEVNAAPAP